MIPSVSVVIPAYNASRTIASSIESVRTVLGAVRIIVVDDGSTDATAAEAAALGAEVIVQTNQGASKARARGLDAVETELVIALDSDDELDSGMEAAIRTIAAREDVSVVGGAISTIDAERRVTRRGRTLDASISTAELLNEPKSPWPPCAAVWRTSALRAADRVAHPHLRPPFAEDYELLIRASLVGRVVSVPAYTARYRSLGGKSTVRAVDALRCAEKIRQHYATYLGLAAEPVGEATLRRWAAWRVFRGRQAERGLAKAVASTLASPGATLDVLTEAAFRVAARWSGR